jgi:hypothetical protein
MTDLKPAPAAPNAGIAPVRTSPRLLIGLALVIVAAIAFTLGRLSNDWKLPAAMTAQGRYLSANAKKPGVVTTESGLQYQMVSAGKGAKPTDSDVVLVQYEGKLLDGTTFDKSQQPTPFPVTGVVPGFSEGLKLMPKGAKYKFWIKPDLAYGTDAKKDPAGKVVIPGDSVLEFDVELLDFLPEAVVRQMQAGAAGVPPAPAPPR